MNPRIRAVAAELREHFGREDGVLRVSPADHGVIVYIDPEHPKPARFKRDIDGVPIIAIRASGRLEETLKECPCKVSMRIMTALGAKHSAKMHAAPLANWSREDWPIHFEEEEVLLLPVLRKRGLIQEVDKVLEEHRVFLRYLERYGEMPEEALAQHAAFEDWLASTYLPDLDPAWKGRQLPRAMHPDQIAKLHSMAR